MKTRSHVGKASWDAVMQAARKAFPKGNRYGVQAFGIDRKAVAGRRTQTAALNVYVLRKLSDPKHRVPNLVVRSRKIVVQPDVIGLGAEARVHKIGDGKPAMLGLYAGAVIRVGTTVREYGGVACLLGDTTPTHFLTAGHLFPPNRPNIEVMGAPRGGTPIVIGRLVVNLLDKPYESMEFPLDVALVELTPAGIRLAASSHDGPLLTDFAPSDETQGIEVKSFLPTAHDYSRPTTTLNGPLDAQMQSPIRGVYFVRQAIGTETVITNRGDSGTILCDAGPGTTAVGICTGQLGTMSVFEPVGRALAVLRQNNDVTLNFV